jgi:hypothetical protein
MLGINLVHDIVVFIKCEQGKSVNMFEDIIDLSAEKIRDITGSSVKSSWTESPTHLDAKIEIDILSKPLAILIKNSLSVNGVERFLASAILQKGEDIVLMSNYINPKVAEYLKQREINYVDTVGNMFIKQHPVYIYVSGNKNLAPHGQLSKNGTTAFHYHGLKIIFGLLRSPSLLNKTYREISVRSNVALGTVNKVFKGLKQLELISPHSKASDRIFLNRGKLFDRWVDAFSEKLMPKIALGTYISTKPLNSENFDVGKYGGFWGGEVAAAVLTNYLKPEIATLYIPKEAKFKLIKGAKLKKATDHNQNEGYRVELFELFWDVNFEDNGLLTPNLITYAGLISTNEPRNVETAMLIREKHLDEFN